MDPSLSIFTEYQAMEVIVIESQAFKRLENVFVEFLERAGRMIAESQETIKLFRSPVCLAGNKNVRNGRDGISHFISKKTCPKYYSPAFSTIS